MRRFGCGVAILMAGGFLAGCGVKNLPTAPGTGERPTVVSGQPNDRTVVASSGTTTAVRAPRIAGETSEALTGAEVTRIPSATRKSFPLDPLLN